MKPSEADANVGVLQARRSMAEQAPGVVRGFFRGLREVFVLERAEERAAALGEEERTHRKRCLNAARARRAASRKLSSPVAANVLLREALAFALRAARNGFGETFDLVAEIAASPAMEHVASDRDRVIELVRRPFPLAVDDLPFAEAEALRASFEACIAEIVGGLDTRTVTAVRALRVGRLVAAVLALALLVSLVVRSHFLLPDVARGKPVTTSPLRAESPSPDHVVDGVTRGTFGVHTLDADKPFIALDLQRSYSIDHVGIFNRGDGWYDECLPLLVEVSEDGVRFHEVARRTEHFDVWTVPLGGHVARFVRVSKPERGYIALNEIEVYGSVVR